MLILPFRVCRLYHNGASNHKGSLVHFSVSLGARRASEEPGPLSSVALRAFARVEPRLIEHRGAATLL